MGIRYRAPFTVAPARGTMTRKIQRPANNMTNPASALTGEEEKNQDTDTNAAGATMSLSLARGKSRRGQIERTVTYL